MNRYLVHHGILGQKWGKKNGPPYPLEPEDHSVSEKKARKKKATPRPKHFGKIIASGAIAAGAIAAGVALDISGNSKLGTKAFQISMGASIVGAVLAGDSLREELKKNELLRKNK